MPDLTAPLPPSDLSELLTGAARVAVTDAAVSGVRFFYDFRGPTFELGEQAGALSRIAGTLLHEAVHHPEEGFVFFSVDVLAHQSSQATVVLQVTRTSNPPQPEAVSTASPLQHGASPSSEPSAGLQAIHALCKTLSGELAVGVLPLEGYIARADLLLPCGSPPVDLTVAAPTGMVAWLIGDPPLVFESIERRLHRLGWTFSVFRSAALAQAAACSKPDALPSAVIALSRYGVTLDEMNALSQKLPAYTALILGCSIVDAAPGRATHGRIALAPVPFSPRQLFELTKACKEARAGTSGSRPGNAPLTRRPLALVVEDNHINQILVTEVLNVLGFEVDLANNGQEAIEHCLQQPPDIILMDLDMPVMGGLEATRRLRSLQKEGRLPHAPILALTARSDEADVAMAEASGMDSFMQKPLDIAYLHREIRRLLPSCGQAVQSEVTLT